MGRHGYLDCFIVAGGHPKRESAIVDECFGGENEDVVQHSQEAVRFLGWYEGLLPVQKSALPVLEEHVK